MGDIKSLLMQLFNVKSPLPRRDDPLNPIRTDMGRDHYPGGNWAPSNQMDLFRYLGESYPGFKDPHPFFSEYTDEYFNKHPEQYKDFLKYFMDWELNELKDDKKPQQVTM